MLTGWRQGDVTTKVPASARSAAVGGGGTAFGPSRLPSSRSHSSISTAWIPNGQSVLSHSATCAKGEATMPPVCAILQSLCTGQTQECAPDRAQPPSQVI